MNFKSSLEVCINIQCKDKTFYKYTTTDFIPYILYF